MLAIIPARGGSKGVPGKNIRDLVGHPLIYYTIDAAIKSKKIDQVIVSTDDKKIADIAIECGAEVPFLRPEELASDHAKAIDNYIYTIDRLNAEGCQIDNIIVLQPTSPLRTVQDIDNAIELFFEKKAETIISVVKAEHPPTWYKKISSEGILIDYFSDTDNSQNRQEADKTYLPNGAIYVFDYAALKTRYGYYNEKTYPYIMSQDNSIDIDTMLDFKLAQLLIEERNNIKE